MSNPSSNLPNKTPPVNVPGYDTPTGTLKNTAPKEATTSPVFSQIIPQDPPVPTPSLSDTGPIPDTAPASFPVSPSPQSVQPPQHATPMSTSRETTQAAQQLPVNPPATPADIEALTAEFNALQTSIEHTTAEQTQSLTTTTQAQTQAMTKAIADASSPSGWDIGIGACSIAFTLASLVIAILANRTAKKANQTAQEANKTAQEANRTARETPSYIARFERYKQIIDPTIDRLNDTYSRYFGPMKLDVYGEPETKYKSIMSQDTVRAVASFAAEASNILAPCRMLLKADDFESVGEGIMPFIVVLSKLKVCIEGYPNLEYVEAQTERRLIMDTFFAARTYLAFSRPEKKELMAFSAMHDPQQAALDKTAEYSQKENAMENAGIQVNNPTGEYDPDFSKKYRAAVITACQFPELSPSQAPSEDRP